MLEDTNEVGKVVEEMEKVPEILEAEAIIAKPVKEAERGDAQVPVGTEKLVNIFGEEVSSFMPLPSGDQYKLVEAGVDEGQAIIIPSAE